MGICFLAIGFCFRVWARRWSIRRPEEGAELLQLFEQFIKRHDFDIFGITPKQFEGFLLVVVLGCLSNDEAAVDGI
jgi:hypothetical protein